MIARIAKIQISRTAWSVWLAPCAWATPSRMKVISATPVTP